MARLAPWALLFVLSLPASALAQSQGMRIDRFLPPATADDGLGMPTASTVGHLEPAFGLVLDYALDPLVARSTTTDASGSIVAHRVVANVLAALGVLDLLEFHLRVPVVFQAGYSPTIGGQAFAAPDVATVADPAIGGSVRIFGEREDVFHLGAMVEAFIPLTGPNGYASDEEFSMRGLVLADVALAALTLELAAGASYRPERLVGTYRSASEFYFSAGGRFAVVADVDLFVELLLGTGMREDLAFQAGGTDLELLLGGRFRLPIGLSIEAGVGLGFLRAPGTPSFRAFAGVRWDPPPAPPADQDADGVNDETDPCPAEAEDVDRFRDDDGCPEPDDDEDGVLDEPDQCDREAEDVDGWHDDDGCPDPDDDEDRIPDADDACPRAPGGRAGDGCPTTLRLEGDAIVLLRSVDFEAGAASLAGSNGLLLDELTGVMGLAAPEARWRVVVRPAAVRRDDGRALATARAEAIVRSLVSRGIAAERLEAAAGDARDDEFVRVETLSGSAE